MNIEDFWTVIEKGKLSAEPESELKKELEKLTTDEVVSYQEHFDTLFEKSYQWNL